MWSQAVAGDTRVGGSEITIGLKKRATNYRSAPHAARNGSGHPLLPSQKQHSRPAQGNRRGIVEEIGLYKRPMNTE